MSYHSRIRTINIITTYVLIFSLLSSPSYSRNSAKAAPEEIQASAAVSLTKSDSLLVDQDGDGMVGAGDTIRYTLVAKNTGSVDASGVMLNDVLDGNLTLTPGSLHSTPLAYTASLDVPEDSQPVPFTLLAADFDGDSLVYTITANPTRGVLAGTAPNLTYQPTLPDYFGTDSLTFQVCDAAAPPNCDTAVVTINILPVNDMPSFTAGAGPKVLEESGPFSAANWAAAISKGPANESGQVLNFIVTSDNAGLFSVQPVVAANGTLTFTPAPNAYGQAVLSVALHDDGGTALGGSDTSAVQTVMVTVDPVNDAPSFSVGSDVTVQEDAGLQTLSNWAQNISAGPNETGQTLTFEVIANTNPGLFAAGPSISSDGTLTFQSSLNLAGTATITLRLRDNGGTANGGVNLSGDQTFKITVQESNDAPVVSPASFGVDENSPAGTLVGTVTYTDPDFGQSHVFSITGGNVADGFAIDPTSGVITVANSGALNYETTPVFHLTVTVTDNGTPAASGSAAVDVTLTNANDAPVVNPAAFSLPENSLAGAAVGTVTVTDQDSGQAHTFTITTGNTGSAFTIDNLGQITVLTPSVLDFETHPTFSLTVQATDNGSPALSGSGTVKIDLSNVNEAPTVNTATFFIPEYSENGTEVGTVTYGDQDSGQVHTFAITAGNPNNAFAIDATTGVITVANTTELKYKTTPSFSLTVTVTDNGSPVLNGAAVITVNLSNVNDAPVVALAAFDVPENSTIGTSVGTVTYTDEDAGQTHTFTITAGNTGGAFAIHPTTGEITVAGSLDHEALPVYSLVVTVTDNGAPPAQGSASITVNITDVNEPPTIGPNSFNVDENSLAGTSIGTLTVVDPETSQTHAFEILSGNTSGAFAIDSGGQLTVANAAPLNYELTPAFPLQIQVTDSGVPATVVTWTLTVNLNDVNEAPSIEDAAFNIDENLASGQLVGTLPVSEPDGGQTHIFEITAGNTGTAFAINSSGQISVANTAALNFEVNPTFTLTVRVTDSGTPALNDTAQVTVTLNDLNEAPIIQGESYQTVGNTVLQVAASSSAPAPMVFVSGNLLANDSDPDAGSTLHAEFNAASPGAVVTVTPAGEFTYLPPAGVTSDSFTYRVVDQKGASTVATVTITLLSPVWYVKNDAAAGGLGRSVDPFDTLAEAEAASKPGETIYIYYGDGTSTRLDTGITLKNNQRLIGAGVALNVPVSVNGGSNPTALLPMDQKSFVVGPNPGTAVTIQNVSAEVRGLNIGSFANGIDVTFTGTSGGTITVQDNNIIASMTGLNMLVSGGSTYLDLSRNTIGALTNGISANRTGGTLTITGFADNQVDGPESANAAYINGAIFDAVPGGALDPLNLGVFRAGTLSNPVIGSGLTITNAQGDLRFTSLDISASGANALLASGTGAGLKLSIDDGQGRLMATNGAALSLTSLNLSAPNLSLTSANSATDGVKLASVTGTLTIKSGSVINGSQGTAFLVSGGSATVLYNGIINQTAGRTVEISGWNGSSATFTGAINGGGTGVLLQDNTGGITSFVGGLMLNTGTNNAFTASNAGTVVVTGATNILTTTSGTALSVSGTTIGSAGLTFQRISASGAPVGIELLNTGSQGGTTVTGTGTAGSGGNIQNTSDDAVRLIGTQNVSLNYLNINNAATSVSGPVCGAENATNCTAAVDMYYVTNVTLNGVNLNGSGQMGVSGYMVNGLSIINSTLVNAGNGVDEYALLLHNPSGTLLIQDSNLAGMFDSGIRLYKYDSPVLNLILRRATISFNNPMAGEDGLQFKLINATANMLVEDSVFKQLAGNGIDGVYQGSTQLNLTAQNNSFLNSIWKGGVSLYGSDSAGGFLTLNANTFTSNRGTAVMLTSTQFAELNAKVANNTIATSFTGEGIHLSQEENSTMTVLLNGNQVSNMSERDISAYTRLAAGSGSLHIQATGNTAEVPLSLSSSYAMDFSLMDTGHTVCLNLDQNTAIGNGAAGIRVRNQAGVFQLEGALGALTADAAAALINSRNTSITDAIASLGLGRTFTGVASGTCRTAVGAVQLPAAAKASSTTARPAARAHGLARLVSPSLRAAGETVSVNIGTLPAGKSVTLTFDALVADPLPADVFQVSNQAVLRGSNFADVLSDDPSTPAQPGDPTITQLYSSPIAEDDLVTLSEDAPVTVSAPGVLANDLVSFGYTLHVASNTSPASGTLALAADGGLNYAPAPDSNGDMTFSYVANDSRHDSNPALVTLRVQPVNDAPVLDPSGAMHLDPVGATSIFGAGTLISNLLNSAGDRISDVDAGAVEGIAITTVDSTHGSWQYTTNGGLTWQDWVTPPAGAALLLASDADTRLRFISYSDFFGTVDPAITFRAWDRTLGTNGATADVSVNGGTTAFSAALETASIEVYEVADLRLSKTASESEILTGNAITYTLEVTNEGPSAAHNVRITDPLPAGIILTSTGPGCTQTGGIVTCEQASLDMGATASFTLSIDVPLEYIGTLINTATAASDTTDLNTGNNIATATVNVIGQVVVIDPSDPIDPADWSNPIIKQPDCGSEFMGEFNNETVTLSLDALPQHTDVTVEFDLVIIRSWDGNQISRASLPASEQRRLEMQGVEVVGPDVWSMDMDGKNIITTTFSNWDALGFHQAYPGAYPGGDFPARTGAVSTNTMCYVYTGYNQDTVYHMRYRLPHSASTLKVDFSAIGLQPITDESWGLNNIMVSVSSGIDPTPYRVYLPVVRK